MAQPQAPDHCWRWGESSVRTAAVESVAAVNWRTVAGLPLTMNLYDSGTWYSLSSPFYEPQDDEVAPGKPYRSIERGRRPRRDRRRFRRDHRRDDRARLELADVLRLSVDDELPA